jgi:peptide deformylase
MMLEIVHYGNPVLRQKGARVEKVTPEIRQLAENMFETMVKAKGVGLAAQQVGRALQLATIDVRGIKDRPSTLEINGQSVDPEAHMPLALINPELKPYGDKVVMGEGCLSFPEIYSDVSRSENVEVKAINEKGEPLHFKCGGLLARAVQHETDHLNGILFIDRMTREDKDEIRPELDELQTQTKAQLQKKKSVRS